MRGGLLAALMVLTAAGTAQGQYRGPRSGDYLFAASASGSRGLWVNPVALGAADEASVMLEGLIERDSAGDYPLAQYTVGFNSRGFGFGFRRDFFSNDAAGNTWRVGFGRALGSLAVGAAVSIYSGRNTEQDVDIGLRYRLGSGLDLALGVEHIGQPTVRDSSLRFGGSAGLSWTGLHGLLGIDLEARGSDELTSNGVLMFYRGGLRLRFGTKLPIALNGALELDNGFATTRALLGLSLGGDYRGVLVGGGSHDPDADRLSSISVVGEASRRFR